MTLQIGLININLCYSISLMLNKITSEVTANIAEQASVITTRVITSEALFAGKRELVIKHAGHDYRLHLTA